VSPATYLMEARHANLRDVGLSLRRLLGDDVRRDVLPFGRLLRCGAIDGCTFNELRRAMTIVNLRMGEDDNIHESLVANNVTLFHEPAANSLDKYNTADKDVQTWIQTVVAVFAREDVSFPILVHCRSGKDRTGVIVAALLLLLEVPQRFVVKEFLLSSGAAEKNICLAIQGFEKAGGIRAYLSHGNAVDVDKVCANLLGCSCANERAAEEVRWLQKEVPMMCSLAHSKAQELEENESTAWCCAVVDAAAELSQRLQPGEAAAALYCQGWALRRLLRFDEACEVLSVGLALARKGKATEAVVRKLEKELSVVGEEVCVLEVSQAADVPGDPHVGLMLWTNVGPESVHVWRALRCPVAFSWLRCGEVALSASPETKHLEVLKLLGLSRVRAEPLGKPRLMQEDLEEIVGQIAAALGREEGCLVHCSDGFVGSGIVGACFLVAHGLEGAIEAAKQGPPQMMAGEAIEVLRLWRPGSLVSKEDEDAVHQFAQAAWARHVEKVQRAFGGSSAVERKVAPAGAKRIQQPGDGNCLFHSLSYAFGASAAALRSEICAFIEKNPDLSIAATSLAEWVQMLAGTTVAAYAKRMSKNGTWGGAPEIAACAHMKHVNIHVFEIRGSAFELTVPFDVGGNTTVAVLYVGGVHYDALTL